MSVLRTMLSLCALSIGLVAQAAEKPNPICLMQKCGKTMMQCSLDKECRGWLQCVAQCGDNKIKCPSYCGFFYQSPRINEFSSCSLASKCVDPGFAALGTYEHLNRPIENLDGIEGTYWFAASHGGKHIFDYGCQRFDFSKRDDSSLAVRFSVPLNRGGETRIKRTAGVFRTISSGAIEVSYDNFAGYQELWYLVDKTDQTLLARVCIGADGVCYDYGTILLSKVDLATLDEEHTARLQQITRDIFGFGLADFKRSNVQGCPN